jgi:chaperone required for assembly of F1-ATPase
MRDIFDELYAHQPLDPNEAARRSMRQAVRQRFFASAGVGAHQDEKFAVLLDGKPVKTPGRRTLAAPIRALAERIVAEWDAQRDAIVPATMPLTRLANAVIDAVAEHPAAVEEEIVNYLGSDMVLYRADAPAGLIVRQAQLWDPVLDFARERFGARFILAQGVVHVTQPRAALEAAARAIPSRPDSVGEIWRLGAIASVTTLTGSALLALALAHGAMTAEAVWAAAHVDEDWNMAAWGRDEAALERRALRLPELEAAAAVLQLAP